MMHCNHCLRLPQVRVKVILIRAGINARCPHHTCWWAEGSEAKRGGGGGGGVVQEISICPHGFLAPCSYLTARASGRLSAAACRSVCERHHPLCNCLSARSFFSFLFLSAIAKSVPKWKSFQLLFCFFFRGVATSLNDCCRRPHYNCFAITARPPRDGLVLA